MAYGELKVDSITFTDGGSDTTVSVSGLVKNPTFSGDIVVSGNISGTSITGDSAGFGSVTGVTVTGTTANFVTVSGTTVTGNVAQFTTLTGGTAGFTTVTGNTGVFASGTEEAPSVSVGTTDNGIYSPGTDQVAISTNGTGRLFISDDGKIGIGTATPSAYAIQADDLVIAPSTSTAGISLVASTANFIYFSDLDAEGRGFIQYGHGDDSLSFGAGANQRLSITSNGDVNIVGAGTPDVTQSVSFNGSAPIDSLVIDSSGRLGLGTSAPGSPLHIVNSSAGIANGIELTNFTGNSSYVKSGRSLTLAADFDNNSGTTESYISFETDATERLRIDFSGLVGVGTTDPLGNLQVAANGDSSIVLANETTNTDGQKRSRITKKSDKNLEIRASDSAIASETIFSRAIGAESARIDSSGRLLVGTTTTSDTKAKIGVAGSVNIGAGSGNSVSLLDGLTGTIATPVRGYSYINISRDGSTDDGLLLLVFANDSTLTIVSTLDNRAGTNYTVSVSGRNLQVTNETGGIEFFYASCMTLAWGNNG